MEKYYLAIDMGGTYLKFAHINQAGNIIFKDKIPTPKTIEELKNEIHNLIESYPIYIKGVGISCPGKIDDDGVVYYGGGISYLHGFRLKEFVSNNFSLPCSVVNDGKAAALSELWIGNLKDVQNGIAIVLGTGVGGGVIIDGKIIMGNNFQAGELSFMIQNPDDANSLIGSRGSAVRFIEEAATLCQLDDLKDGTHVFEHIERRENPDLQRLFENYCREIAHLILNLQAILDVQKIVIGGGISEQKILISEINQQYLMIKNKHSFYKTMLQPIQIEQCKFKNEANLLGALYHLFLEIEGSYS